MEWSRKLLILIVVFFIICFSDIFMEIGYYLLIRSNPELEMD